MSGDDRSSACCMRRRLRHRAAACAMLVAALGGAAAGCGRSLPATGEVRGRVTLDGRPLDGAAVLFVPEAGGAPGRGATGADGSFALSTFAGGDGALVGRHRVAITKDEMTGIKPDAGGLSGPAMAGGPKVKRLVPARYADLATSGLTADVTAGETTVEFALESR